MNWVLKFQGIISGQPVAMGRPRMTRMGKAYTPAKSRVYMESSVESLKNQWTGEPLMGPIKLVATFVSSRPQVKMTKHFSNGRIPKTTKPDIDNHVKMLLDIITRVGIWDDDKLVVSLSLEDWYCSKIEEPHVVFQIYTIQE